MKANKVLQQLSDMATAIIGSNRGREISVYRSINQE